MRRSRKPIPSREQRFKSSPWRFSKPNIYIITSLLRVMAATPPGARKRKMDYMIDQAVFDEFMKACSRKGYAPQVLLEQAMKKFIQTGQI